MKKIILIIFFLLITFCGYSQNKGKIEIIVPDNSELDQIYRDSIKIKDFFNKKKKSLETSFNKGNIILEDLNEYLNFLAKENLHNLRQIIDAYYLKAKRENNLLLIGNLDLNYSRYYFANNQLDSCRLYIDKSIKSAKKNNFNRLYLESLSQSALYFIVKSEMNRANDSIDRAIGSIINNPSNVKLKMKLELVKADVLFFSDSIINSINLSLKVLNKTRSINNIDPILQLDTYLLLSKNYHAISDNKEDIKYINLYLELARIISFPYLNQIYDRKAAHYFNLEEFEKAIVFFDKSIKLSKISNNKKSELLSNSNKATTQMYLGKFDEAENTLKTTLEIEKKLGLKEHYAQSLEQLSRIYYYKEEDEKSRQYFENAEKIAKSLENNTFLLSTFYENKYLDFKINDNYKEALYYYEKFKIINDTIFKAKFYKDILDTESKLQTQQKINEIGKLYSENIQKEASLTESKYISYSILGALLLVIGLGYFYWNKRKQTYKLALLQNSIKSSEAEKTRIGKELHDNIAGTLIKLVHDSETAQIQLSHKLLKVYNEVRDLSHQLNITPIQGELFLERILDIIPENNSNQQFNFDITPRHLQINEPNGTHIYRIIQELIANNLKYAKATTTTIKIVLENDVLTFTYNDNGVGSSPFEKGKGYKNIEDRIALMNGKLQVEQKNGFSTVLTIPYTV